MSSNFETCLRQQNDLLKLSWLCIKNWILFNGISCMLLWQLTTITKILILYILYNYLIEKKNPAYMFIYISVAKSAFSVINIPLQ